MKATAVLIFIMAIATIAGAQQQNEPDTLAVGLKEITVKARWKNDTDRYHYNQMKHYVTIVLPYVNAATKLFNEINTETNDDMSRRERRHIIKDKQEAAADQFADKVKQLNITQGQLLVKLIARQTGLNIYDMLQEYKNSLTAVKWQAWAKMNGMNLNKKYDPAEEPDLENIMEELGYPLPAYYAVRNK